MSDNISCLQNYNCQYGIVNTDYLSNIKHFRIVVHNAQNDNNIYILRL